MDFVEFINKFMNYTILFLFNDIINKCYCTF